MNSKERVLAALGHTEPDRLPVNYLANAGIDRRLKEHFGLHPDDKEGLLAALGVDYRHCVAPYVGPRLHAEITGVKVNPEWGIHVRWVEHPTGGYWDYCDFPLKGAAPDAVASWPMPLPDGYDYACLTDRFREHGDKSIWIGGPGIPDVINSTGMIFGMEDVLVGLMLDDEATLLYIDRKAEILLRVMERTLEAGKGMIDGLWMGEDLGTQISPMISIDLFRKHIRPRHQKFIDLAKSYGLKVMLHSCGSSSWAFDDLIDMGVDCVDTLQPEAKDMSPACIKSRFGDRLAFHGCISTAGPLAYGTAEEVTEYCREIIEIMSPGGGYCFAPTHCIQDNSPVENVLAMYSAVSE